MPTGIPKGGINKGWFQKGHKGFRHSKQFKKGHIPWCAGTKGIVKAWNKGKPCPKRTKDKIRISIKKLWQNPEFRKKARKKRQTKVKSGGSYTIYTPNHPYATKRGYIIESRLVMEKHLGRYLKPNEVVHHINKNRFDNCIKNLQLFDNMAKHFWYHKKNL